MALAVDWHVLGAVACGVVGGRLFWFRKAGRQLLAALICFAAVLVWWLSLRPSDESNGSPISPELPGLRFRETRSPSIIFAIATTRANSTTPASGSRIVDLNQIEGVDLFMNYWGSPLIAHTILSFHIQNESPVAFSIETRRRNGQTYSAGWDSLANSR